MNKNPIDNNSNQDILTLEEVAQYLRKSTSWVYKHWQELGGRKLGGSLFFPRKEDLYECLFCKRKGVQVRFHPEGDQVHGSLVQNKNGGQTGRSKKKGGAKKSNTDGDDPNRYGLLDLG
jgi:predicted DNA-binding transcriptional regulator AlpA